MLYLYGNIVKNWALVIYKYSAYEIYVYYTECDSLRY